MSLLDLIRRIFAPRPIPPAPPAPAFGRSDIVPEALGLINALRAGALFPAGPMAWHDGLAGLALAHARDMAQNGALDHRGSDGRWPGDRARASGFGGVYRGEVIAWNYRDADDVVSGWSRSPGHRRILVDRPSSLVGVAVAFSASGEPYWCAVTGG